MQNILCLCRLNDLVQAELATYNQHGDTEWRLWFDSAAAMLQLDSCEGVSKARNGDPKILAFGVTAAVLSRTIALQTCKRLLALHGAEFEALLQAVMSQSHQGVAEPGQETIWWTEYALYALVGCHSNHGGLFDIFHQPLRHGVYAQDQDTVYHASQLAVWNASHVFREDKDAAPLIFFQSLLGVRAGEVAESVEPFLQSAIKP